MRDGVLIGNVETGWRETFEEIPVISFAKINGTLEERKQLAEEVRAASADIGFFYIKDSGIPDDLVGKYPISPFRP
jgi:isopenicillin N synthase-like dioxygenase